MTYTVRLLCAKIQTFVFAIICLHKDLFCLNYWVVLVIICFFLLSVLSVWWFCNWLVFTTVNVGVSGVSGLQPIRSCLTMRAVVVVTVHWTVKMVGVVCRFRLRCFQTTSKCSSGICQRTCVTRSFTSSLDVRFAFAVVPSFASAGNDLKDFWQLNVSAEKLIL